jgi:sec-independent protein translocase protein TatB
MFDVGFDEMLVVAVVAIVVIGPKDLPLALRSVGRWVAKVRSVSGHFRSGIETMIREAELEEMEKKWADQNAAIMSADPHPMPDYEAIAPASAEAVMLPIDPPAETKPKKKPRKSAKAVEPMLPL